MGLMCCDFICCKMRIKSFNDGILNVKTVWMDASIWLLMLFDWSYLGSVSLISSFVNAMEIPNETQKKNGFFLVSSAFLRWIHNVNNFDKHRNLMVEYSNLKKKKNKHTQQTGVQKEMDPIRDKGWAMVG